MEALEENYEIVDWYGIKRNEENRNKIFSIDIHVVGEHKQLKEIEGISRSDLLIVDEFISYPFHENGTKGDIKTNKIIYRCIDEYNNLILFVETPTRLPVESK